MILYELLAGRPPFKGESAVSVAYQHVSELATPPSAFNKDVSPELDEVVLRSMTKDRDERFQTAEEFRENLLAAQAGQSPADNQKNTSFKNNPGEPGLDRSDLDNRRRRVSNLLD